MQAGGGSSDVRYRLEYTVEFDLEDETRLVADSPAVRDLPDLSNKPTLKRWRDINVVLHASLDQVIASGARVQMRNSGCTLGEIEDLHM